MRNTEIERNRERLRKRNTEIEIERVTGTNRMVQIETEKFKPKQKESGRER